MNSYKSGQGFGRQSGKEHISKVTSVFLVIYSIHLTLDKDTGEAESTKMAENDIHTEKNTEYTGKYLNSLYESYNTQFSFNFNIKQISEMASTNVSVFHVQC